MRSVQAQMVREGKAVSLVKLCSWLGIPRRTVYYKPCARCRRLDAARVSRVKAVIETFPTYGDRRIAVVLGENKKPIQRILQHQGSQVRKRPRGHRPRAKAMPSVAPGPNRWATDRAMVWCGRHRCCHLALVIDCGSRELIGWRLSKRGHAKTVEAALKEALIHRFGCLGRVPGGVQKPGGHYTAP